MSDLHSKDKDCDKEKDVSADSSTESDHQKEHIAAREVFSVGEVYNCSLAQHVYVVPSSNLSPVDITVPGTG